MKKLLPAVGAAIMATAVLAGCSTEIDGTAVAASSAGGSSNQQSSNQQSSSSASARPTTTQSSTRPASGMLDCDGAFKVAEPVVPFKIRRATEGDTFPCIWYTEDETILSVSITETTTTPSQMERRRSDSDAISDRRLDAKGWAADDFMFVTLYTPTHEVDVMFLGDDEDEYAKYQLDIAFAVAEAVSG
ncbi:MAG: hypothetical protein GX542_04315 [Rhodococcus sp.]|nr:hypothetical protein [Rhodococcus sp. (in: high G+C Gram-positive bacteria)]